MSAITPVRDPQWEALIADYHVKHAAWLVTEATEEELATYRAAVAALPALASPPPAVPEEYRGLIVAELLGMARLESAHPAVKAWASHHREFETRQKQSAALRQQHLGAAQAREDAAKEAYFGALNTLAGHRVSSLKDLAKKIEIIDADYNEGDVPHERLAEILADVRHLAAEA
jgi:hypothetical protein